MASFLYLVAGVVIGLVAGWFVRGASGGPQAGGSVVEQPPSEQPSSEKSTDEASTAEVAEPAAATSVEAEPVTEVATVPGPRSTPEAPVAEEALAEEPVAEEPVAEEPVAETVVVDATPVVDEPAGTPTAVAVVAADDLTKVAGIGPKTAAALTAAGISTYRQLADADVASLKAAISNAGMRPVSTVATWPVKAKVLADAAS